MKRMLAIVPAVLGIIALVVTACGGSEAAATPRPSPTTVPGPSPTAAPTATAAPTPTARPPAPTATPAAPAPKRGSVLKSILLNDPANWDAYDSRGQLTAIIAFLPMLSNIIVFDAEKPSLILPDLAERWEQSGDGKSATFFLRKDVKWHNGKDLTAQDVAWNIDRGRRAEGTTVYNKARFAAVDNVETPDAYTVKVNLKRPSASFLPNMAVAFVLVYPPVGPDPASSEFKQNAIGTGPFKFKSYTAANKIELVRNDSYYKKDEAGRTLPYLDGVTLFPISDPANSLATWRSKQVDCGCHWDFTYMTSNADALQREFPDAKLVGANTAQHQLVLNSKGPLADVRVRQAIFIGLDRLNIHGLFQGGIKKAFYPPGYMLAPEVGGKWGLPASELLQTPGFRVKDGKKDPADIEMSQRLFREAGVDPKSVTLILNGTTGVRDQFEIIQSTLQETGVKVDLRLFAAPAESTNALIRGDFGIYLLQGGNGFDDPSDQPTRYLLTQASENYGKFSLPKLDAIYDQLDSALDSAKRLQLAYQFQRAALEEAVAEPAVYFYSVNGPHRHVFGWIKGSYSTNSGQRLERVWIDESLR